MYSTVCAELTQVPGVLPDMYGDVTSRSREASFFSKLMHQHRFSPDPPHRWRTVDLRFKTDFIFCFYFIPSLG